MPGRSRSQPAADAKEFRWIARGAIWFGAFVTIVAVVDFVTAVGQVSLREAGWRYSTLTSLTGYIGLPVIGVFTAAIGAHYLERRVLAARLGLACKVLAALLVLMWIGYLIDSYGLRRAAAPTERASGDYGVINATVKYLLYAVALFLVGRALTPAKATPQGK